MAPFHIVCEGRRDVKGYRLVKRELPARRMHHRATRSRPIQSASLNEQYRSLRVVRLGGDIEFYRPLDEYDLLYFTFANKARTPEGMLDFIEKYGPLTAEGLDPKSGEPVAEMIDEANQMYELLMQLKRGEHKQMASQLGAFGIPLAEISLSLIGDRIMESLKLDLFVKTLIEGLWAQFGLTASRGAGAKIEMCLYCGDFFETGPSTGRRFDAKFCSDDHRVSFHSLKRSRKG